MTEVAIHSGVFQGADKAVVLEGARSTEVIDNTIVGQIGLESKPYDFSGLPLSIQEIRGNFIEGNTALLAGSGAHISENYIAGSLELGSLTRLTRNFIRAHDVAHAVILRGSQGILDSNTIIGGSDSAVMTDGDSHRISHNSIITQSVGILVSGKHQMIDDNHFRVSRGGCGITFTNDADHVHRANLSNGSITIPCGFPNIQAPGEPSEPITMLAHGRTSLPASARFLADQLPPENTCADEKVVFIHDIAPTSTPFGPADLAIDRPGYYLLTQDITLTTESNGIAILSDGVTLDLGGFSVLCSRDCLRMVRVRSAGQVTIRNGTLFGGAVSIEALATRHLRLEDLYAECGTTSTCRSLSTSEVDRVEIERSWLLGLLSSAHISAATGRISRSEIGSVEGGLLARFSEGAEISESILRGDKFGLQIFGDALVTHNLIIGSQQGSAVVLQGGRSSVTENIILGNGGVSLDVIGGRGHIVQRNLIRGGMTSVTDDTVFSANVLVDNLRGSQTEFGISYRGSGSVLDNNMLLHRFCGVLIADCHGVALTNNVILDAHEGICGTKAYTEENNLLPASTCGNDLAGPGEMCDGIDPGELICDPERFGGCVVDCNASCDGFDILFCPP